MCWSWGRVIGQALAHELVGAFVGAKQSQEERHLRRLVKIEAIKTKCGVESLKSAHTPTEEFSAEIST